MGDERFEYFPFFVDRWVSHTALRLSDAAYRIYHLMICHMFEHGQAQYSMPYKIEAISKITGRSPRAVAKAMKEIMGDPSPLLRDEGGMLVSNGLRKTIEQLNRQRAKAVRAATKRHKQDIEAEEPRFDGTLQEELWGEEGSRRGTARRPGLSSATEQPLSTAIRTRTRMKRDLDAKNKPRGSPKAQVREGPKEPVSVGAVMREGNAASGGYSLDELVERFMRHFHGERWCAWWRNVLGALDVAGGDEALVGAADIVKRVEDSGDRSKDVGEFKEPRKWLTKRTTALCKMYGVKQWPDFPAG